jgi:rare lipoprotein A (peptidoglycan hydrolase)
MAAVLFALPAAVLASDGGADAGSGGGATYYEPAPTGEQISIAVAPGAWVGRSTRVRGRSADVAGETLAIESRRSRSQGWVPVASVRADENGRFAASWTPSAAGRHEVRAVSGSASSAAAREARSASAAARVTVYRRVTATWYGPGFYGNRTACGKRLTTSTQGVAHRTLPCGARVAIRVGGRSVVVPVIDRGPYARGVSYDLTGATARRLGVTHTSRIGAAVLNR